MAEFPALPFWTDAYLADTTHLSEAEHGRYLLLLIHLWRMPEKRFPNEDDWLARKFCREVSWVRDSLRPLISEFCQNDGNWITQKKISKEWKHLKKNSERQSVRAKSRWKKETEPPSGNAASGIAPTPTPTPTPLASKSPTKMISDALGFEITTSMSGEKFIAQHIAMKRQGIDIELDLVPVIRQMRAEGRIPQNLHSLAYFLNAAKDHKAAREIASQDAAERANAPFEETTEKGWVARLRGWLDSGFWPPNYGPRPLSGDCRAPPHLLEPATVAWSGQGGHPAGSFPVDPNGTWTPWAQLRDLRNDPNVDYGNRLLTGAEIIPMRRPA